MKKSRRATDIDKEWSVRLARLRKAKGLTQQGLGDLLDVSAQQIGKYERGESRIPIGHYQNAIDALDTDDPSALDLGDRRIHYHATTDAKSLIAFLSSTSGQKSALWRVRSTDFDLTIFQDRKSRRASSGHRTLHATPVIRSSSHLAALTATFTDAPRADEVVIVWAFATRGRLHARLGGLQVKDVVGEDGLSRRPEKAPVTARC